MVLQLLTVAVPATMFAYITVLTGFRFVTLDLDNYAESMLYCLGMAGLFSLSYLLLTKTENNQEQISTQLQRQLQLLQHIVAAASLVCTKAAHTKFVVGKKFPVVDLTGKVYIVTGSNTGIGFETAKQLVAMNATVVLACRSQDRADAAKKAIVDATLCAPSKVIVILLDLCSFESVRKFVKDFHATDLKLNALINNAGLMMDTRQVTKDGHEMVMTANHFSHFLLTNLLLDDLKATNGRVVNLSSSLHHLAKKFNFDDIMAERYYSLFPTYAQSKLANILFTKELQKRLDASGSCVGCYAVHPGIVRTEVTRHMNPLMRIGNQFFAPLMLLLQKTPLQGAYCSIYAAISDELIYKSAPSNSSGFKYTKCGELLFHCRPFKTNSAANDSESARKLWEISEKITGLTK